MGGQPSGATQNQRWFPALNASNPAETIPGYGVVRIGRDGTYTFKDGQRVLTVGKPLFDDEQGFGSELLQTFGSPYEPNRYAINSPTPIIHGQTGRVTMDYPAEVLYELGGEAGDGTTSNPLQNTASGHAGPVHDEWFMRADGIGFIVQDFNLLGRNSPQLTSDPLIRAFVLPAADTWPAQVYGQGVVGDGTSDANAMTLASFFVGVANGQYPGAFTKSNGQLAIPSFCGGWYRFYAQASVKHATEGTLMYLTLVIAGSARNSERGETQEKTQPSPYEETEFSHVATEVVAHVCPGDEIQLIVGPADTVYGNLHFSIQRLDRSVGFSCASQLIG